VKVVEASCKQLVCWKLHLEGWFERVCWRACCSAACRIPRGRHWVVVASLVICTMSVTCRVDEVISFSFPSFAGLTKNHPLFLGLYPVTCYTIDGCPKDHEQILRLCEVQCSCSQCPGYCTLYFNILAPAIFDCLFCPDRIKFDRTRGESVVAQEDHTNFNMRWMSLNQNIWACERKSLGL
jgi:hypothetical protein